MSSQNIGFSCAKIHVLSGVYIHIRMVMVQYIHHHHLLK